MVNIISARAYGFGNDLNSYPVDETKQLFGQLKRNNQFLNVSFYEFASVSI
jgi:hypothetical protein